MMNFNKVILMGRLTSDPKLRTFDGGGKVVSFTVATNRSWKSSDGQRKEESCFTDCKAFGQLAQTIADYMAKGRPIHIDGHLHDDKWEDKETGKEVYRKRVIVDSFEFIDKKSNDESVSSSDSNSFMSGSPDDYDTISSGNIEDEGEAF